MSQTKAKKRVTKRGKVERLEAKAAPRWRGRPLPEELDGMYRPVKKAVTMWVDADVLAWFQREGPGYQTRINRALRELMTEAKKSRK
jgi:uncharacterized protein (DUF4415 family)